MLQIKSPQNLGAGIIFLLIGIGGIYFSSGLTYGAARNMGPGYFPMWLSASIAFLGLIAIAKAFVLNGPVIERLQWRPVIFVSLATLLFGYIIGYVGLALALVVMTMIAVQGRSDTRQKEMLILAVVMALLSVIVFVYILKQGMPAWWGE